VQGRAPALYNHAESLRPIKILPPTERKLALIGKVDTIRVEEGAITGTYIAMEIREDI
jgi:hypothetical protein